MKAIFDWGKKAKKQNANRDIADVITRVDEQIGRAVTRLADR